MGLFKVTDLVALVKLIYVYLIKISNNFFGLAFLLSDLILVKQCILHLSYLFHVNNTRLRSCTQATDGCFGKNVKNHILFGEKVSVSIGDFRQTLPMEESTNIHIICQHSKHIFGSRCSTLD